jgi:hypothetical protein
MTGSIQLRDHFGDMVGSHVAVAAGRDFALVPTVRGYWKHLCNLATGRGGEIAIAGATVQRARLAKARGSRRG